MMPLHEREWAGALILIVAAWIIVRVRTVVHLKHQRELERFRLHVRMYTTKEPR